MTDKKYSVQEIDALREVVRHKYLYGSYSISQGQSTSRSYMEAEMNATVEQQVRTHMLAGHTAQDLRASEGRA